MRGGCSRLAQRVRAGEGVLPHAALDNFGRVRKRVHGAVEELVADRLAGQAQVGDADRVAVAIETRLPVAAEMRLDSTEPGGDPMPDPLEPHGLVEPELV